MSARQFRAIRERKVVREDIVYPPVK